MTRFHPAVLAVHAEFGGDLELMQVAYEHPDLFRRIEMLEKELHALRNAQSYLYIGKDGKPVLARDLEDRAEAAEKRVAELEADRAEQWRLRRDAEGSRDAARAAADSLRMERDELHKAVEELKIALFSSDMTIKDRADQSARLVLSTTKSPTTDTRVADLTEAHHSNDIWRYEIQYGPEGEANYAWVYRNGCMVATMKTRDAMDICRALSTTKEGE